MSLAVKQELPAMQPQLSPILKQPNFFVVGAPKAGTTSIYHYLDQHPHVYMSPIKEPHYFADEVREDNLDKQVWHWYARDLRGRRPAPGNRFGGIVADWQDYLGLFADSREETALGEASVLYLWSPSAPVNIASKIPHAKIIVILRDPIERAFSQYLHGLGCGAIRWSFREHIQRNLCHRSGQICVHYPCLEFGLYSEPLRRYLEQFGKNVWIGLHEDFKSRPLEMCRSLYAFLAVDPEFTPDTRSRYLEAQVPRLRAFGWLKRTGVWEAVANATPRHLRPAIRRALIRKPGTTSIDPADRRYLLDFYRADIQTLSGIIDHNFDSWLR